MMDMNLTLNESRVIGCLLEKESTTPDQYPLTLNGLMNACNQKSNREPVLSMSEAEVRSALETLINERLVSEEGGARASKYRHRFCNTEFSTLQFTEQQRAVVCCLLLRGPQTPGELRGRTGRMAAFADVKAVEETLKQLLELKLIVQLPREPGKREARYGHLFSADIELPPASEVMAETIADDKARIQELEHEVMVLKAEIDRLSTLLTDK